MKIDRCKDCGSEMRTAEVDAGYGSLDGFRKRVPFCPKCHPSMIDFQVDEPTGNSGCAIPIMIAIIFFIIIWQIFK